MQAQTRLCAVGRSFLFLAWTAGCHGRFAVTVATVELFFGIM